jgi:hypothetical protein
MVKLKVLQDFHDWQAKVLRQKGAVIEVTEQRFKELSKNLEAQGVKADTVVEVVKEDKKVTKPSA